MGLLFNVTLICLFVILQNVNSLESRGSSCPQMHKRTFEGYIPKGNKTAGEWSFIEDVTELEDCVTNCCKNKTCNAAIMFNDNCYTLDCDSNIDCLPKLHHNVSIRDNISMVLVRPEKRNESWKKILKAEEKKHNWKDSCPKLYEFTYRGYLPWGNISAGNFSYIKDMGNLKNCTLNCCDNDNCHVAIMHRHKCYNVECKSSKLCVPIRYHNSTIRKNLSMVLVKPVEHTDKWKDILEKFDGVDESSEELLPEISANEETTTNSPFSIFDNEKKTFNVTFRLPRSEPELNNANETFEYALEQIEGPTKLQFQLTNDTIFDIKKLKYGDYVIKLNVKKKTIYYVKKDENTEATSRSGPVTTP